MALALRHRIQKKLFYTMTKFKCDELETCVMPNFPEITWNEVMKSVTTNHLRLTPKSAATQVIQKIKKSNMTDGSLLLLLLVLELKAISRHPSSKVWQAYQMKERLDEEIIIEDEETIKNRLSECLKKNKIECKFEITTYNGVVYLGFQQNKFKLAPMVFFALCIEKDYLFCSTDRAQHFLMRTVLVAMNFQKRTKLRLRGKHLDSLLKMLDCRERKTLPGGGDVPEKMDTEPIINERGIDATRHKQRREFAEKCMGDDESVQVENMSVITENFVFKNPRSGAQVEIDFNWNIHSQNLRQFIPQLAEKGILTTPLPEYIKNFMTIGQTEMTIK